MIFIAVQISLFQFSRSVMFDSATGLPVHRQLPEFSQTYVHWVGDAIQLSRPLLSPSPPYPTICLIPFQPALHHINLPAFP